MDYYELIKTYGSNMSTDKMWKVVRRVSDFIDPIKDSDPHKYWKLMRQTYADIYGEHFDKKFAEWQISQMYYTDKMGVKRYAPYWSPEIVQKVYDSIRSKIKSTAYTLYDFDVALNKSKSDNYMLYSSWWPDVDESALDQKFIDDAINFMNDEDSPFGRDAIVWNYFKR